MRGFAGAADEGEGVVGQDRDVFGTSNHGDGAARGECGRVVDGDGVVAAVGYDQSFAVGSDAGEDGFVAGFCGGEDGVGAAIDGEHGVVAGCGDVGARAVGGEIQSVGLWPDGNARDEPVGARVEDPDETCRSTDAPNFRAGGVLADARQFLGDGNVRDSVEIDEVDDGQRAVGGGDISAAGEDRDEEMKGDARRASASGRRCTECRAGLGRDSCGRGALS